MSLKVLYCLQKSAFVALKGFFDTPNVQQSCHPLPEHIIEEEWYRPVTFTYQQEQIFLYQAPDEFYCVSW
jgi:hypothetical protein